MQGAQPSACPSYTLQRSLLQVHHKVYCICLLQLWMSSDTCCDHRMLTLMLTSMGCKSLVPHFRAHARLILTWCEATCGVSLCTREGISCKPCYSLGIVASVLQRHPVGGQRLRKTVPVEWWTCPASARPVCKQGVDSNRPHPAARRPVFLGSSRRGHRP